VTRRPVAVRPTTLGPSLHRRGDGWAIDLTDLPLFHGLSVLSRALGEQLVERCEAECFDIDVERRLKAIENPELATLGCAGVTVHAERDVVAHVPGDVEAFQHHLRAVFGTLQQTRWRRYLLPDDRETAACALVFTFLAGTGFEYRFVLDRVPAPKAGHRFYLRIAIESPRGRRLDLAGIAHVVVDDLDEREYIAGSTRIAQTLRDMVHREADRGRRLHLERRKRGSFVFDQLERGGLGELSTLHLAWNDRFAAALAASDPGRLDHVLKRVLLLLEDRTVRDRLRARETISLISGDDEVFLDLSQQGRVLNLAFDQPRGRATVASYLGRMPALGAVVRARATARPLGGLSCILVHHITAEVLGLVAALRALGCDDLDVLFVRYAGEVPNEYLDALLDLDRTVRSYALQNVQEPGGIEGHFVLSQQLSPLDGLERIGERLRAERTRYFEAMVATAVGLFVRALERGRRVLVVEDGGYLVPTLMRAAAAGATVASLAAAHGIGPVDRALGKRPLRDVLAERLIGSVEHTRSGFDRLAAVEREVGLVRPAYSIAISRLKIEEEAREVAAGVLAAIESVLHARGAVLSRRRPLVIGSRGAIGRRLVDALAAGRVSADVLGIDLAVARRSAGEARTWHELPPARRRAVDLVIGVTGLSVLAAAQVEELIRHGTAPTILFASGSTKTVEFRDVAEHVERLMAQARPRIDGLPVAVTSAEVTDPQSGRRYGTAVTFRLGRGRAVVEKTVVFIANLTPVNFLFYGVPTEAIDRVMAQLLRTTLALVRDVGARRPPPARLYAVDRDLPAGRL
jgi:S-adenosylhomocysteine hydrolase